MKVFLYKDIADVVHYVYYEFRSPENVIQIRPVKDFIPRQYLVMSGNPFVSTLNVPKVRNFLRAHKLNYAEVDASDYIRYGCRI